MGKKQMEGDNRERRKLAKDARDEGKRPSEVGATLGASKQRTRSDDRDSHQKQIDQMREGKHNMIAQNTPSAKPGNRDADTPDRESHPRL